MLEVERAADLKAYEGKEIGVSDWYTVTQEQINKFADATGDHQWIHVDVERVKREMPGGKTIAHGWLTLSLVPRLASPLYRAKHRSRAGCARPRPARWSSKAATARCSSPRRSASPTIDPRRQLLRRRLHHHRGHALRVDVEGEEG